jgi:hypothetical protein
MFTRDAPPFSAGQKYVIRWRIEPEYQAPKQNGLATKGEVGAAFTIMPPYASTPNFVPVTERQTFLPQDLASTSDTRRLPIWRIDDPEALPIGTARRVAG